MTETDAPFIVAVLGIDGSGKSTLSRRLAVEFSAHGRTALIGDRAELFDDGPVDAPGPLVADQLRQWIGTMVRKAESLDDYKLPKITELVLRDRLIGEVTGEYKPERLFMDGMPLFNIAAWTILYRAEHFNETTCAKVLSALSGRGGRPQPDDPLFKHFPELTRMSELGVDNLRVADATIFLDVPANVCMKRIEARGKKKQVHETEESLSRLRDAYLLVCTVLEKEWGASVQLLDGARDIDAITADACAFVEERGIDAG